MNSSDKPKSRWDDDANTRSYLGTILAGDVDLFTTYWVVGFLVTFGSLVWGWLMWNPIMSGSKLGLLIGYGPVFVVGISWCIAVLRAAGKYKGPLRYRRLAQVVATLGLAQGGFAIFVVARGLLS